MFRGIQIKKSDGVRSRSGNLSLDMLLFGVTPKFRTTCISYNVICCKKKIIFRIVPFKA